MTSFNLIKVDLEAPSKAAKALIEQCARGLGALYEPLHMVRLAKARVEVARIEAASTSELGPLEKRAIMRAVATEARTQVNIESIVGTAASLVSESAEPERVDVDWIAHFFDSCRNASSDEMRRLWSRILAGEADRVGSFSKRALSLVRDMDLEDAKMFAALCRFCVRIRGVERVPLYQPLIMSCRDPLLQGSGVTQESLLHLQSIGLITINELMGQFRYSLPHLFTIEYGSTKYYVTFRPSAESTLPVGMVCLTLVGEQLARVCEAEPVSWLMRSAMEQWSNTGAIDCGEMPTGPSART